MEIIPRTEELIVYGFDHNEMDSNAGVPALKRLFACFREFQTNAMVPEFVVRVGDFNDHWWIGVPAVLPQEVTESLRNHLKDLPGFKMDSDSVPNMTLVATWKYTPKVVFVLADISGGDVTPEDYGSGIQIKTLECMVTDLGE